MTFGMVINQRYEHASLEQAGFAISTLAAGYGAMLGAGWARGTVSVRDLVTSLISIAVAGASFPVGALFGGSLATAYADFFASEDPLTPGAPGVVPPPTNVAPDAPSPREVHPSFGVGAEKGAVLSAMAGYALCRWALQSPTPKDKDESLPTRAACAAMTAHRPSPHGADALHRAPRRPCI